MEIRANANGRIKNLGRFIRICYKNSDKLSTPPPPGKHQSRSPMGSKVEILTFYVLFKTRIGVFQNQIKL
jgi:hypothetical protein